MGAELKQNRLVLVSNGEPYKHIYQNQEIKQEKLVGGLTTGLDPMMQEDDGLWIAWGRGEADFEVVDQENKVKVPDDNGYTLKRIKLSEEEKNGFYCGVSNEVMWPICHTFISKANFKKEYWDSYKKVNKKFADNIMEELEEDDLVWIHDYHLALVPGFLSGSDAKTSLFWHIPWPAWEAFRTIPWRQEILEGMLSTNFLGFHTDSFVYNFLNCAKKIGAEVDFSAREVYYQGSKTRVENIPLGIDYQRMHGLSQDEEYLEKSKTIKENYNTEKLVFAVDCLDYTKGIEERLEAIRRFFEKYPEYQRKVIFVQRIAPSRTGIEEYQQMKDSIEKMVGEINGKYQEDEWQPIKYFYGSVPQDELLPYYNAADLGLITASIDGMNLVAKEYLAVQDSGVLLLSEFAGAAEYLDSAIKVNPYDVEALADSIYQGLEMPEKDRKERVQTAQAALKKYDINWWRDHFIEMWLDCYE